MLKFRAFSFPKSRKILPKAVRTRTNKVSLIGQVIFKNNLNFFISYIYNYYFPRI